MLGKQWLIAEIDNKEFESQHVEEQLGADIDSTLTFVNEVNNIC